MQRFASSLRNQRRLRTNLVLLLAGLCLLQGCALPPPLEPEALGSATPDYRASTVPVWTNQPLSWEKLDEIERWLEVNRSSSRVALVARAELELAEGRLTFAKEDPRKPRVIAAEDGFRRVLSSSGADAEMLRRAHQGLLEARSLTDGRSPRAVAQSGMEGRAAWRAKSPNPSRLTRHRGAWTRITVHHSARTVHDQLGGVSDAEVADALRRVQKVHMDERGFGDIGYHFLIDPRGRVYEGRSMTWQGAHSNGANNVANIGICLFGNFDLEAPSRQALEALEDLVDELARAHSIPRRRVYAHRELRATECPGDRLMSWLETYRGRLTAARSEAASTRQGSRDTGWSSGSKGRIR